MSEVPARRSPHRPGIRRRAVERPPAPYSRYGPRDGPKCTNEQNVAGLEHYLRARRSRKEEK